MNDNLASSKYSRVWSLLGGAGFVMVGICRYLEPATAGWVSPLGWLLVAVCLSATVAGSIAGRRAREAGPAAGRD